jgi:hypothetical protein
MGSSTPNSDTQTYMSKTPNTVYDDEFGHVDKSVLTESMIEALEGNSP